MGNTRKWRTFCSESFKRCKHTPKSFHSDVGHIWDLVVRKRYGTHVNKPNGEWNRVSLKACILHFKPPAFWWEENWNVKVVERKTFTATEMKKPLNWFFARLILSISSVSTEQSQIRAQHHRHTETFYKIISRNSQNFLKIKNCRNFAMMLVS